ncbi:MAG: Asp-tRNA(Asn)/Glu-tRNA(Gln) amidotransferase GatCAB subunit C [Verrucomicrobia bacterium]|nr:MAG: Asp-tRNA(Asn)/Glu-tRNA(Gln) amidotransferase GatCAB subunit C [Verrucomicrobiota bacterium]
MSTHAHIDIDYVANLARIALSDQERSLFSEQLEEILEYIEQLKSVDVDGVEPTAHTFPVTNVWREDVVRPGLTQEEAIGNAPEARDGMFVVPKVVE